MTTVAHHDVLVIGGGNAGISLAARLHRYGVTDIAVVEPKDHHLYQPLFSHIAGGRAKASEAIRSQASVTPKGVEWIHDAALVVNAAEDTVTLESGEQVTYNHLVVCPGMQLDWDKIPGLAASVHSPFGASHYDFELAPKAWTLLSSLTSGTAVFTMPSGPAKCAGAAQKPMYLACDYWKQKGVLDKIRVVMVQPYPTVYGVDGVDDELNRKIAEYGIELRLNSELTAVDPLGRTVVISDNAAGTTEEIRYDVLNAVPPQSAPDWLKATDLPAPGNDGGFVQVNPETLRHVRYPNVWSLGDAAATTNSKCGGALRKQTKVLAKNLVAARKGAPLTEKYDGYAVCPFTVSGSTVVFA
ncbi:MAG: FAD-dependent pyridine nucleotide-disulfide oxidoreductase [Pseudarthrobacter sp.]|nr:FAD-dependent pyridine nucleotide-disulfide oxidoreductase [Pseudarthrobacter sp.]